MDYRPVNNLSTVPIGKKRRRPWRSVGPLTADKTEELAALLRRHTVNGAEGIPSTTPHQVSLLQNRISSGSSGISNEPQSL